MAKRKHYAITLRGYMFNDHWLAIQYLKEGRYPNMAKLRSWKSRSVRLRIAPLTHDCESWRELLQLRRYQLAEAKILKLMIKWGRAQAPASFDYAVRGKRAA